jgi:hypothetical protein
MQIVKTISDHLQKVFANNELQKDTVIRKFHITASDGKNYNTQYYTILISGTVATKRRKMTTIKKKALISIIILSSIFCVVAFLNLKNFHAKFFNKTGENIDSLMIGNTFIGKLKKDGFTEYINFKEFEFDSGFPYENVSGKIKKKILKPDFWSDCGTERYSLSNGTYEFDIKTKLDINGEAVLYLAPHNRKTFWE